MRERLWYSIEDYYGEKIIHYHGYALYCEDGLWLFVDLMKCFVPLADVLDKQGAERAWLITEAEYDCGSCKKELSEMEAEKVLEEYYGGYDSLGNRTAFAGTHLQLEDLTADAPLGSYWFE